MVLLDSCVIDSLMGAFSAMPQSLIGWLCYLLSAKRSDYWLTQTGFAFARVLGVSLLSTAESI